MYPERSFDYDDAERAADLVREKMKERGLNPDNVQEGMTLGSGLGSFADKQMPGALEIPYGEIYERLNRVVNRRPIQFSDEAVPGHAKKLVVGPLNGDAESDLVIGQSGREHLYEEGISPQRATFWLRVMQIMKAKAWIGSNASGAVTPQTLTPPTIMLVEGHRDRTNDNSLFKGHHDERFGPRFPHLSDLYSQGMVELFAQIAQSKEIEVARGLYFREAGPHYEQTSDVYDMRTVLEGIFRQAKLQVGEWRYQGPVAGSVGMSSSYEALVAQHASQSEKHPAFVHGRALLSAVTNYSASLGPNGFVIPSNHAEVGENARCIEDNFARLVIGGIHELRKTYSQ